MIDKNLLRCGAEFLLAYKMDAAGHKRRVFVRVELVGNRSRDVYLLNLANKATFYVDRDWFCDRAHPMTKKLRAELAFKILQNA